MLGLCRRVTKRPIDKEGAKDAHVARDIMRVSAKVKKDRALGPGHKSPGTKGRDI